MLNLRLYRLTLVLGLLAGVILMFSLASRPDPLSSDIATDGFDSEVAATVAERIARLAPDRSPGSAGDGRAADFVAEQLGAIEGATVSERRFAGTFDGDDVLLRNVVAVIPGATSARIVIAAPRDCDGGPCGASSAASTAALIELGRALSAAQIEKTFQLVSLDGSVAGAAGAKQLADELEADPARAVIVLYQPGAADSRGSPVLPWGVGPEATSVQLTESASRATAAERDIAGDAPSGTLSSLLRLAVPAGTGDQAPLVSSGSSAIALAAAGDLPLPASADGIGEIDADALGGIGRTALGLSFALDDSTEPLDDGPGAYVPLAGKLIPGWSLSLLALALLLPVGIIGGEATVRGARKGRPVVPAALWVASRAACFLAPALAAYALAFVGIVPETSWPFDPADFGVGLGEVLIGALLAAILAAALLFARRIHFPDAADAAIAPVIASLLFLGALGLWVANPYLALVCVPAVHLWLLASLPELRARPVVAVGAVIAGLLFPLVAVLALGDRLDSGIALPWHLTLMFTGGHFGASALIPICLLAGCLIAIVVVAVTRPAPERRAGRPSRRRSRAQRRQTAASGAIRGA